MKQPPIRDPESRNYLPSAQYQLNELPPFIRSARTSWLLRVFYREQDHTGIISLRGTRETSSLEN
ncbi:hypothetical protein GQ600_26524 [Phytophthora cactorum]|nr:hypothetical protein GQ600_26524 [Phytophthora cactorum]